MKQRQHNHANPVPDPTTENGWQLLNQVRRFKRAFDNRWSSEVSDTVTPTQFRIMRAVATAAGCDQTALTRMCEMDTSTVGAAVGRLLKRGYLARESNPFDRRRAALTLTPAGQAQHDQLVLASSTMITGLMTSLPVAQLASAPALRAFADPGDPRPGVRGDDPDPHSARTGTL